MENREQACSRAQLIEAAWPERRFVDAKRSTSISVDCARR
ncbi:helix-turn-helix domain-containing protein [Sinorhizobium meliloti]|nr:helix-turn-helix domain-containing protein [Sinorhizobium meliloti]